MTKTKNRDGPGKDLDGPIPAQTKATQGANSPLDLRPFDWKATAGRTIKDIQQDRITLVSAGLAFYWFLAVFPALIAGIGLLDLLDAGEGLRAGVERAIGSALPGQAATVLNAAIDNVGAQSEKTSLVAATVGIAVALWSASSGMAALQAGLDVSYNVEAERKFVKKRLYALALLGAALVFGGLAVGLIIFGGPLSDWIGQHLPAGSVLVRLFTVVRWLAALVLLTVLVALFYYVGPNRPNPNWKWITPGGLLAVVVWLATSKGFSLYAGSAGTYKQTYGPIAGVVILIFWQYLTGLAILAGAELNAELERQSAMRAQTPEGTRKTQ